MIGERLVMTIGHSTRPAETFLELLRVHGVAGVADVRRIPQSRRYPHFSREALSAALPAAGIEYRHYPGLGGHRQGRPDSPNGGWRHPSFRAYADHMASQEFHDALQGLLDWTEKRLIAVMCAEAQWWRCHRQLVADALVARGVSVRHIMAATRAPLHELTSFARVDGSQVLYPGLV